MRRILIGVVAGMLLPLSPAHAAEPDQTVDSLVQEATRNVTTPEQLEIAVQYMLNNAASDEQKEAILSAAMSLNSGNEAALAVIGSAAEKANVPQQSITLAALNAQVSPDAVLAATAAGNGNSQGRGQGQGQGRGLGIAPGQTGNRVIPPPFGSNAGGGGGGNGSPSA